jgi:glycine/D-amino acid oxidase-like deaminating enzyme
MNYHRRPRPDQAPLRGAANDALLRAYRETEYHVHASTPFTLRIGVRNAELHALHEAHGVRASAFVTACNPRSEALSTAENATRQQQLREAVRQFGLTCLDGAGQHPTNGWPAEPSLLILGLDRAAAEQLGRRFEQNAIVWIAADAIPVLVVLD